MKKYTPKFLKSLLYNLIFWVVVFLLYYIFGKAHLTGGIIFIIVISLIYALLDGLIPYYIDNRQKGGLYLCQGIKGIITLTLCSASLVLMTRFLQGKVYTLFGLFLILAVWFYVMFDKIFQKESEKNK